MENETETELIECDFLVPFAKYKGTYWKPKSREPQEYTRTIRGTYLPGSSYADYTSTTLMGLAPAKGRNISIDARTERTMLKLPHSGFRVEPG